jgi:hypothetical protein
MNLARAGVCAASKELAAARAAAPAPHDGPHQGWEASLAAVPAGAQALSPFSLFHSANLGPEVKIASLCCEQFEKELSPEMRR